MLVLGDKSTWNGVVGGGLPLNHAINQQIETINNIRSWLLGGDAGWGCKIRSAEGMLILDTVSFTSLPGSDACNMSET